MGSYIEWLRQRVGHDKFIMIGTASLISDEQGRVLLQKRRDSKLWGFPGGAQELGESIADTCRREVCEEVGLWVEPTRLIGVYTSPQFDRTYPNGDVVQMDIFFFECKVVGGALKRQKEEVLEIGWFDLDALPEMEKCCVAKAKDAKIFNGEPFIR